MDTASATRGASKSSFRIAWMPSRLECQCKALRCRRGGKGSDGKLFEFGKALVTSDLVTLDESLKGEDP